MVSTVNEDLYRENAIAIESEARDSINVQSKAGRRACARKERNLHCDVHVATVTKAHYRCSSL